MEKQIKLMGDGNVPIEDLFKGDYEVHAVQGMPDTYVYTKVSVLTTVSTVENSTGLDN
ncbi:hypothetical protein M0R04_13215 [Candidatus Dojkabacteria bacterium]|jgi:hypothetical protein|nr:hypothetical protein [Candidatus Dojkabacteria bacterium]